MKMEKKFHKWMIYVIWYLYDKEIIKEERKEE